MLKTCVQPNLSPTSNVEILYLFNEPKEERARARETLQSWKKKSCFHSHFYASFRTHEKTLLLKLLTPFFDCQDEHVADEDDFWVYKTAGLGRIRALLKVEHPLLRPEERGRLQAASKRLIDLTRRRRGRKDVLNSLSPFLSVSSLGFMSST